MSCDAKMLKLNGLVRWDGRLVDRGHSGELIHGNGMLVAKAMAVVMREDCG